ncbi:MAG TPA: preprotein translocase subunit SecE [Rickettsiales bacterium]|nr:preprotein translocase subunit SecE [Rickettsiales bacterium]
MINVKYFKEVIEECRKIVFPKWKDVYVTAIYISVVVFIMTLAIIFADFIISHVVKLMFGLGI